jgi:ADP-ribosylglycohydrolase
MIGHAVGDALGVPVEFCAREELLKNPVMDMMGFGSYPMPAGAWSDDTSMSVAALDSLANGEILYDEIMGNFVKWANLDDYTPTGEMFDIGVTCKKAIRKFVEEEGISPLACGLPYENANGNGSLMRIHPFVLMAYFREDLRPLADMVFENASRLTHAHERSVLACKIYGRVLFSLIEKPSRESVFKALAEAKAIYADNSEYSAYRRLFSDDFEAITAREIRSSGYVVDTLEAAIWCLLTTGNYAECVLKAVNLGEDTDTVAAVAGGLAGALYGYETIPKKWRDTLIKRAYIEEMCDRAAKNW